MKIFIAVLALLISSQAEVVTRTQSGTTTQFRTVGQIQGTQLFTQGYPSNAVQKATASPQPSSWNFLDQNTLGGQAQWVTPTPSQQLYPVNTFANYSFTIDVDCPHQPSSLRIAATGVYTLSLNGQKTTFLGTPYSFVHSVTFNAGNFQCGTNRIDVQIANLKYESPLALIYTVTQDTSQCYQCHQELGQSFFNKNSCGCQCKLNLKACNNTLQQWLNYPFCRCQCALPPCQDPFLRDPSSCQCLKPCPNVTPCPLGQIWSNYRCTCISKCGDSPVECSQNQVWDPVSCQCSCQEQTCPGSQVFSSQSCECGCPYTRVPCPEGKKWDELSCQCECPDLVCAPGTYLSSSSCKCELSPSIGITPPPTFSRMSP